MGIFYLKSALMAYAKSEDSHQASHAVRTESPLFLLNIYESGDKVMILISMSKQSVFVSQEMAHLSVCRHVVWIAKFVVNSFVVRY